MIDFDNHTNFELNIEPLENITHKLLSTKDVELILCDNMEIKELNKEHRNIDMPTDVLSFPLEEFPHAPLGTIIISIDYAKDISSKLGHTVKEEVALLFIHGMLHLTGMDHESDNGEMRQREIDLIEHFNLPKSLIVRSSEQA